MKRITAIGLMLIVLAGLLPLFAEEELNLEVASTVNFLIKQGLEENLVPITRLSSKLSMTQKRAIYRRHKVGAGIPFAINLCVGAGIGSFVQGDIDGGLFALVGDVLSISAMLGGYAIFVDNTKDKLTPGGSRSALNDLSAGQSLGLGLMAGGGIGLLIFRIYELIQPLTFAEKRNNNLQDALGLFAY